MTSPSSRDSSRDPWIAWLQDAISEPDGRDAAGAELLEWLVTRTEMAGAVAEMKASIRRMEAAL